MAQFLIHVIVAGNGWMEIGPLSIVVKGDETVQGFGMSDSVSGSDAPCALLPTCYVPPPAVKKASGRESATKPWGSDTDLQQLKLLRC